MLSATGALYAAIDLTAGEKDRATMQTLLCAPIHNLEIASAASLARRPWFNSYWCVCQLSHRWNRIAALAGTRTIAGRDEEFVAPERRATLASVARAGHH